MMMKHVPKTEKRCCVFKDKCEFNIKLKECFRNHLSQGLMLKFLTIIQNWNLEMLVFEERGKPDSPEKNLSEVLMRQNFDPIWCKLL